MSTLENPEKDTAPLPVAPVGVAASDIVNVPPVVSQSVSATSRPVGRKRWGDLALALLYMSPALAIFILFTFVPFVRSILLSMFNTDQFGEPIDFNNFRYYSRVLNLENKDPSYLQSLWTTLQFSLMVVPLGIAMAVGLAALAMSEVRGITVFRTIFTSSVAISVASAGVIWALIYSPNTKVTQWLLDLLNVKNVTSLLQNAGTALPAVAFMTIWTGLGFNFVITLSGMQAIPRDLYESSRIDGANGWQAFRSITLPLLTPTLLFLFIITTIQCFQSFTQFKVLINGENSATDVFVYKLFREFYQSGFYGRASAMAVVLFVVLLILTLIQFRLLDRKVHYQ